MYLRAVRGSPSIQNAPALRLSTSMIAATSCCVSPGLASPSLKPKPSTTLSLYSSVRLGSVLMSLPQYL